MDPDRDNLGGRSRSHPHLIVEAILWRLRTGSPWRDLSPTFGPWQTAYSRLRRWQAAGVWDRALAALQTEADADGRLDWVRHFVDSTVIRAHQHAAGAKKGAAATRPSAALGADSGPNSTSGRSGAASRSPAS